MKFSCKELGCNGRVDTDNMRSSIDLKTDRFGLCTMFPCNTCGRLHVGSGNAVEYRDGEPLFLREGRVVQRNADDTFIESPVA